MALQLDLYGPLFLHTLSFWWVIVPSIFLGLLVGAIPGFSAANTIIILLPLTLVMDVEVGLIFMVALYCASRMGAGIPAILVNIPGTAGAAATPLDGYPMTKAGRGQQALAMSFVASSLGGLLTTVLALLTMPWLAQVGYYMHSVEMIVVMLFGISLIASIAARDTLKGLIAGFFGLMIGSIGADHVYATPRGTMGFLELYDGVPLIPALVGLFAVSEAFLIVEQRAIAARQHELRGTAACVAARHEDLAAAEQVRHAIRQQVAGLHVARGEAHIGENRVPHLVVQAGDLDLDRTRHTPRAAGHFTKQGNPALCTWCENHLRRSPVHDGRAVALPGTGIRTHRLFLARRP